MVTVTRWCASSGTTCTPLAAAFAKRLPPETRPATRQHASRLRIHLSSRQNLLRLVVKRHLLSGLDRRNVHAQRTRVAVARFNTSVRRLPRPHALHPVAHVGRSLGISVGAGVGVGRICLYLL